MKSIFETCKPRDEVMRGELREDIFAARLKDVMDGTADPVYSDPNTFFDNTYITSGLKTLLSDASARLIGNGSGANAIIRLETAFGGGKTHNLIALYHFMKGDAPEKAMRAMLGADVLLPKKKQVQIVGVVGSDLEPMGGYLHPDTDIRTFTLWGEIAYQISGVDGYQKVRASDESRVAIGASQLQEIIGDQPTLIMLDEIARYMRASLAVQTQTKRSNLADQTVAFLMSLLEFAASKERCLVVLTLGTAADAFSDETQEIRHRLEKEEQELQQTLNEAHRVTARQERVLTPTTEEEIFAIVTHRLFESIDQESGKDTCRMYQRYYDTMAGQNADLPQRCTKQEYFADICRAYPFHPELLVTLNRKVATIPNFNQTRGALRLLAWTVRSLWQEKPTPTWLIHLYHVKLNVTQIAEDLTSRLDRPQFKKVIEADITSDLEGVPSHAMSIDEELIRSGKPLYTQRLATGIFIHSITAGTASGVTPADLILATLTPDDRGSGDDPQIIQNQLEKLYNQAWFLPYWYSPTRANTNYILEI